MAAIVGMRKLGRYAEVVPLSLAAMQSAPVVLTLQRLHLAAAYALLGQKDDAARQITLLRKTLPWPSVSTLVRTTIDPPATRWRLAEGLVKAGVPDHIEEQAEGTDPPSTGIRADGHGGITPAGAPGVETLSTEQFLTRLKSGQPTHMLLTTCQCSVPPMIDMINVPVFRNGAAISNPDRDRLLRWAGALTNGDRNAAIVVIGANAASWEPRNFALSLAELGWKNVAWYRGGLDAWEAFKLKHL